ncbi:MAG: epoxyqueuosine reductase [Oscillospiraceae bacterium]|nr:epoxyqueuosine reductase [Oscillospiraceae bacterium]
MLTAAQVKEAARYYGADLVGIGDIGRWKNVPPESDPKGILPEAKSVICLGFRIHRGTYRSLDEGYTSGYTVAGFADLNNFVGPFVQRRLASYLEDDGYEAAIVVFASNKLGTSDVLFNHRIGAELCGVGKIGMSRLVLTPQFGPGQRFFFLLTDAELEPDPIMSESVCDGCGMCLRECPGRALCRTPDDVHIPDVTDIRRFSLDSVKCAMVHGGAVSDYAPEDVRSFALNVIGGTSDTLADGSSRPPDGELMAYTRGKIPYASNAMELFHSPAGLCGGKGCMRACIAHLESRGRLRRTFNRPFRVKRGEDNEQNRH